MIGPFLGDLILDGFLVTIAYAFGEKRLGLGGWALMLGIAALFRGVATFGY
jgi:hypothetical protein